MIIAIIGEDEFSKEKRIERFLEETLGNLKDDQMSRKILFATDPDIPSIADAIFTACESISMFSAEQVVVARKCEELKADETKSLAKWLSHKPNCKLLLEFSKLDARGELAKALKAAGTIEKYDVPKSYKMSEWIAAAIPTHFNKAIDRGACDYLADALGTDTKLVCEEVGKVLLFDPNCKKITEDLVRSMIVPQRKMISYEINDAFGLRDPQDYVRKLNDLINNGVEPVSIVASLYHYAVDLLRFSTLLSRKMSPKDAAAAMGKNDFIYNIKGRAPECANRWGRPLLCRVIRRLADLDYEIKSGQCSTKIAQELALAALVVR